LQHLLLEVVGGAHDYDPLSLSGNLQGLVGPIQRATVLATAVYLGLTRINVDLQALGRESSYRHGSLPSSWIFCFSMMRLPPARPGEARNWSTAKSGSAASVRAR